MSFVLNCLKFLGQRPQCYHNTSWFYFYFINWLILSDNRLLEFSLFSPSNTEVKIALEES